MTHRARAVLEACEVIVGYRPYLQLLAEFLPGREVIGTGMTREVERCQAAVREAWQGKFVAVVSSGDAGVYGMAGLVLEILALEDPGGSVEVEIVPGVTAATAAAACLGAPLMHDYACISLSDLLTPWELIKKRVDLAAAADFVLALYNPKSRRRVVQIEEVQATVLRHRGPATPVGIVRNAGRLEQRTVLATLADFAGEEIDMLTTVIIGNSQTRLQGQRLVTPRGYRL